MLNKVTLIGHLGADPEVRYMPSGSTVTHISLATTMRWKDKQSGERKEITEWHRIVLFNRLAEITGEFLKKGSQVYIEGRLQTRKWKSQNGQDRYTTEIIASEMHMLGSRTNGTVAMNNEPLPQVPARYAVTEKDPIQAQAYQPPAALQNGMENIPPYYDDFEDDIPF